jgi:cell wall-associated NlpC family hydrolase
MTSSGDSGAERNDTVNKKERGLLEDKFLRWADEAENNKDILWTLEKVRQDFNSVVSSSNGYQSKALVIWQGEVLDRLGLGSTEQVIESVVADAVEAVQEVFESFPKDTVTYSIGESVIENILNRGNLVSSESDALEHISGTASVVPTGFLSRFHSKASASVGVGVLSIGVCFAGFGNPATSAAWASESSSVDGQSLYVSASASPSAERSGVSVMSAPAIAGTVVRPVSSVDVSGIDKNSALVNSALKYLGSGWDCTYLVEQALRDLGYSVPDLGPMQFGSYGTVFHDPSAVQAGDIMMRGGHVAIYAGNGMTVQGGFGFGGVVLNKWDGPSSYSAFVRVG